MRTQDMLRSHPRKALVDLTNVTACIAACVDCADACTSCADACIGEDKVQMLARCIRIDLDCADICQTTARILARQTETNMQLLRSQLEITLIASGICADECEKHAEMHQHCRVCASVCRTCEQACRQMLSSLTSAV